MGVAAGPVEGSAPATAPAVAAKPWGSFSEYYFDLDYIPEGCAWEPRDFPPEDSLYVWGPPCPADFGENKEAWT